MCLCKLFAWLGFRRRARERLLEESEGIEEAPPAEVVRILPAFYHNGYEYNNQQMYEKQQQAMESLANDLHGRAMGKLMSFRLVRRSLEELLRYNNQSVPDGQKEIIGNVVDCVLFGTPSRCPECLTGEIKFSATLVVYRCIGGSDVPSCGHTTMYPLRTAFMVPSNQLLLHRWIKESEYVNTFTERAYDEKIHIERGATDHDIQGFRQSPEIVLGKIPKLYIAQQRLEDRLVVKSGHFVDWEFPMVREFHLLKDDDGVPYAKTIVSCDIVSNLNTVVQVQVYEHDIFGRYAYFYSWKRLGTKMGISQWFLSSNREPVIEEFEKVLNNVKSQIEDAKKPTGSCGVYHSVLDIQRCLKIPEYLSNVDGLHPAVRELLRFIETPVKEESREYQLHPQTLNSVKWDEFLQPAGILTEEQLQMGRDILSKLESILDSANPNEHRLVAESNKFYSRIPHAAGLERLPRLDSFELLAEKSSLIEHLSSSNHQLFMEKPKDGCLTTDDDYLTYRQMHCEVQYVNPSSEAYAIVQKYLYDTSPTSKLGIVDLFRISRDGEDEKFMKYKGNRTLLWHGSRRINFRGILSTGLRLNVVESKKNGSVFGHGLYFSDLADKAVIYCASKGSEDHLLLLADVALGRVQYTSHGDRGDTKAYDSFVARSACLVAGRSVVKKDGYVVPLGAQAGELGPNEYIVFDRNQVCMRYLVRVRKRSPSFLTWTPSIPVPDTTVDPTTAPAAPTVPTTSTSTKSKKSTTPSSSSSSTTSSKTTKKTAATTASSSKTQKSVNPKPNPKK